MCIRDSLKGQSKSPAVRQKTLLEFSQILKSEILQNILLRILIQSKSASLTSVVCSVVLANPDKFYDIALILFKTIELFHYDTMTVSYTHLDVYKRQLYPYHRW